MMSGDCISVKAGPEILFRIYCSHMELAVVTVPEKPLAPPSKKTDTPVLAV